MGRNRQEQLIGDGVDICVRPVPPYTVVATGGWPCLRL
jgi:hypothetical protein